MNNRLGKILFVGLGVVVLLAACTSNNGKETSSTSTSSKENSVASSVVEKTTTSTSTSGQTAKDILSNSKEDLQTELKATPKKDENQKIDPKIIPNFVGMTTEEARTIKDSMTDATFVMSLTDQVYRTDLPEGTILAQSAKPGTEGGGRWITYIASTQDESQAVPIDQASFE